MNDIAAALLPSIGVGFLFYVVIRAILQADRRERAAQRELEKAEDAAAAADSRGTDRDD